MQPDPTPDSLFTVDIPDSLFHRFLELVPDAVVVIDDKGTIAKVNGQAEILFGYDRKEMVNRSLEMLIPDRFRRSHAAHIRGYSADPRIRPMGRGLDLFGLRKNGSEFPIDVSISPIQLEKKTYVASTIRDMTAQWKLKEELRHRTSELEEADRQKDNFLSAIAHELRSPLTVLSLAAQFLKEPQVDPKRYEKTVYRLERQTAHMSRLIEDLLDMTKVRRGTFTLRSEVVDMRAVVSEAIDLITPVVYKHGHQLIVNQCAEPLWVNGDAARLIEIISNLLNNAIAYTPMSGHIWCSAAKDREVAIVRIRDDGIGIPKHMLGQVFELFARTAPAQPASSNSAGLGIGLALVRRLVELHGGTVEAASDGPMTGSEFIVRLPLASNGPTVVSDAAPEAADA